MIALPHAGNGDNASNGVGVVDKVLAQLLCRGNTEFLGKATNLGGTQQTTRLIGHEARIPTHREVDHQSARKHRWCCL